MLGLSDILLNVVIYAVSGTLTRRSSNMSSALRKYVTVAAMQFFCTVLIRMAK